MPLTKLSNGQQTVMVDTANPDYQGYLQGGFKPDAPVQNPVQPTGATSTAPLPPTSINPAPTAPAPGSLPPATDIPFAAQTADGKILSPTQKDSISNLLNTRPPSTWNEIDKRNWAYATNNAPIPADKPIAQPGDTGTGAAGVRDQGAGGQDMGDSGYLSDVQKFLNQFGISMPSANQSPTTAFADTYEQIINKMGLTTAKTNIDALNKEYEDLNKQKIDEIANLNDNPFLSEGMKQAKVAAVNEKYSARENALTNKLRLLQNVYDTGREDARFIAQQTLAESHKGSGLNDNLILKAIDFAEKQAEARAKTQQPFELSAGQTRYAYNPKTGQFEAIARVEKPTTVSTEAPKVAGSAKTGYFQWNPKTERYDIPVGRGGFGSGGGGGGSWSVGTGGKLTDLDILAEAVSNKLSSVTAKNSFTRQYKRAGNDDQRIKILAANVVLPAEVKNGLIQNSQVVGTLNDVTAMLDKGIKTGLLAAGRSYVANKLGTGGDKEIEAIKSKLVAALQPYRNKVTGAAWGDQEEAEYQALVGSIRFDPAALRDKIVVFKDTLRKQSLDALTAGIDPLGSINQQSPISESPDFLREAPVQVSEPNMSLKSGGVGTGIQPDKSYLRNKYNY